ncbi:MAG: hypothetical protein LLG97_02870 [Deltaproteobacteria bacterium]|nr:hypothetical protein [Deltaproteobacteria bacterium]
MASGPFSIWISLSATSFEALAVAGVAVRQHQALGACLAESLEGIAGWLRG